MTQTKTSILTLAIATGEMLLQSGAETYRVEETINRMCESRGIVSQCFVTPSVIIVSGEIAGEAVTSMQRVTATAIDLHRIDEVNAFARDFSEHKLELAAAQSELDRLRQLPHYSKRVQLLGGGLAVGGFAVLFGAHWTQFPIGFAFGALLQLFTFYTAPLRLNFFLRNILASFVLTIFINLVNLVIPIAVNPMIIGSLMPMVPGVAITNSVRDTLTGDFLSGFTRASEAIFVALGIAFGVGLALVLISQVVQ